MSVETDFFDYTFCFQTLSWLEEPQKALLELIRITKPGGYIYLSSLFNLEHDVDLYTRVIDYTRESGQNNLYMNYNTYSYHSITKWITSLVKSFSIHKFTMEIDLPSSTHRGIGTYTKKLACSNERLQISAGMLMNWGILVINK